MASNERGLLRSIFREKWGHSERTLLSAGGFTPDSILLPSRERAREIPKSPNAVPQFPPSLPLFHRESIARAVISPPMCSIMNPSSCKQFGRQFPFFSMPENCCPIHSFPLSSCRAAITAADACCERGFVLHLNYSFPA